jgi:hypothetical protein
MTSSLSSAVQVGEPDPLVALYRQFSGAEPALVAQRQLLRRIDSKFVLPAGDVGDLLAGLAHEYVVMPVPGATWATYGSLYFDTPNLRCFHDHRRGRRIRHKLRIRHYVDRNLSFFEVKTKHNELITEKRRLELAAGSEQLDTREIAFARAHARLEVSDELAPVARIQYRRLTLIGISVNERATIDVGLEVISLGGNRHSLDHVAIVELKQPTLDCGSPIKQRLISGGHRERSLSKYIAAVAHVFPGERKNRLLPDLRALDRVGD